MNTNILKLALGVSLSIAAFTASAQKNTTEGVAIYSINAKGAELESTVSFRGDSSLASFQQGAAQIKLLSNNKGTYFAVLVDVPVANMKKAAIESPDELDQALDMIPKFTFTPTAETKQINGFNCKKVVAKNAKDNTSVDIWVTNDVSAPANIYSKLFEGAGGVPVQFSIVQQGVTQNLTLKSITSQVVPKGTFGVPAGYDHITMDDLKTLSGGH